MTAGTKPRSKAAVPRRPAAVGLQRLGWRVLADAAAGSRKGAGGRCQDVCAAVVVRLRGRTQLLAVCADGAGSASHSEIGAILACRTVLASLRRQLALADPHEAMLTAAVAEARSVLWARAKTLRLSPRELATTLVVAVAGPEATWCAQVGDGALVLECNGVWQLVFAPEQGEYINTTRFVTDEHAAPQTARLPVASAVALLSDGLQPMALELQTSTPFAPFFHGLFAELAKQPARDLVPAFHSFLTSPAVHARTDDDVSLVLALRR